MAVTHSLVDLDRLNRRFQALQLRLGSLQGQAHELTNQQSKLAKAVSLAKARLDLAPQVADAFTYLQEKAHSRAVGEFEDLLSAFVSDVVPEAGSIHLELGTERGAPALDILLDNGGDLENILEGNGGGLTNVVVTGLAFSALSRTPNRQLIVLDEPDCWLKAKYVPNFTKVISEVANPRADADGTLTAGCQTLMISHNDISLMDEGAHIQDLRIEHDLAAFAAKLSTTVTFKGELGDCAHVVWVPDGPGKGHVEVRYREDGAGDEEQNALTKGFPYIEAISGARAWPADLPGIRWVEVVNLRRHVMSRLELSPGLNVLTGDINGGKSTLYFTALRALAYGESDDSMIRHGADSAIVRVGLEDDVVLEMVRNRKSSPKVLYRRYEAGVLVNEGRQETRGGVPSFISEVLKIERVDGLDIQLRSQKQPVFLLDETPARRAQLLSVGKESGLLQSIIEKHRLQLRRDREQVKKDEIELNLVNRTLTALAPVASLTALVELLSNLMDEARDSFQKMEATRQLVQKLTPLAAKERIYTHHAASLETSLVLPPCVATDRLSGLVARLEKSLPAAKLADPQAAPDLPLLAPSKDLEKMLNSLERGAQTGLILQSLYEAPGTPQVMDTAGLGQSGASLAKKAEGIKVLEKEDASLGEEAKAAEDALHSFKHELGVCPACNQTFKEDANV